MRNSEFEKRKKTSACSASQRLNPVAVAKSHPTAERDTRMGGGRFEGANQVLPQRHRDAEGEGPGGAGPYIGWDELRLKIQLLICAVELVQLSPVGVGRKGDGGIAHGGRHGVQLKHPAGRRDIT